MYCEKCSSKTKARPCICWEDSLDNWFRKFGRCSCWADLKSLLKGTARQNLDEIFNKKLPIKKQRY